MKGHIARRVMLEADYMLKTGATVRDCARALKLGKTTVHKDLRLRLPELDGELFDRVEALLDKNRRERHIRGGRATKMKYLGLSGE